MMEQKKTPIEKINPLEKSKPIYSSLDLVVKVIREETCFDDISQIQSIVDRYLPEFRIYFAEYFSHIPELKDFEIDVDYNIWQQT